MLLSQLPGLGVGDLNPAPVLPLALEIGKASQGPRRVDLSNKPKKREAIPGHRSALKGCGHWDHWWVQCEPELATRSLPKTDLKAPAEKRSQVTDTEARRKGGGTTGGCSTSPS